MFASTHTTALPLSPAATDRRINAAPAQDRAKYSSIARALHWISALVIIWALASGMTMASGLLEPEIRAAIANFNVAITTVFTPVFLFRIAHALVMSRPAPLPVPAQMRRAARLGHAALYAVTSVVLVSGVLMMERPIDLFGLMALPRVPIDHSWAEAFGQLHRHSCVGLLLLLAIHVGAVMRHERAGVRVLKRMI